MRTERKRRNTDERGGALWRLAVRRDDPGGMIGHEEEDHVETPSPPDAASA